MTSLRSAEHRGHEASCSKGGPYRGRTDGGAAIRSFDCRWIRPFALKTGIPITGTAVSTAANGMHQRDHNTQTERLTGVARGIAPTGRGGVDGSGRPND